MLARRRKHSSSHSILLKLLGCGVCLVTVVWAFLLFGHYVLCPFHISLCTPFVYWYRRMPVQYDMIDIHQQDSIDIEYQKANSDLTCNLPSDSIDNLQFVDLSLAEYDNDPTYLPLDDEQQTKLRQQYTEIQATEHIKRLILIGIPHGGTTWTASALNKHPYIEMHGEVLFGWTTSYCNAHLMWNDNTRCNWNTLQAIMETFYTKHMHKYVRRDITNRKYTRYVAFKITLWQIMPTMYGEFVRWVYCQNVSVIQLVRSASINSFYSQQAMLFENLFYGRPFFQTQSSSKHAIKNETFDLDAKWTKKFVQTTEFWQDTLMKLLRFHTRSIRVLVVYYEDLISEHDVDYLNVMQAWLNVKYDENLYRNQNYGIARLHAMPCHVKIKNWYSDIKPALIDTQSYYACEKLSS